MVNIIIVESLYEEIEKTFKREVSKVFKLMRSLEDNPKKGKPLGTVGGIVIKELRYRNYRFYFIIDGNKLKCFDEKALVDLLIRFVRMSDKKRQQDTIDEIKRILKKVGPSGLR